MLGKTPPSLDGGYVGAATALFLPLKRKNTMRTPETTTTTAAKDPIKQMMGVALLSILTLLTGCATPMDSREDTEYRSYGHAANRPTSRPVRSISSFSDSLMCMDQLFRATQLPTTLIASKQIPDISTRVPVATKEMIVTALSQMSRLSNAFRYVDYEVDIARQDTVQNLTTILLNNNQIQLQRPAIYVSGAVAFVDQNVLNNRFDVGTSASRLETGYSRNRNATIIGLELHLGDFRTRTLIPGLDSANEVVVGNSGQGLDLAGRISEYGWKFNVGRDYTQGSGAAIRTLVEVAMIELTGKWARVPYWQCLTLEQTHPDIQRQLRDWYDEGNTGIHQGLITRSLMSHGYLGAGSDKLPANSPEFRVALGRFQADSGLIASGVVDFPTYERTLRNFVGLNENGKLTRIGWSTMSSEPLAVSVPAAKSPHSVSEDDTLLAEANAVPYGASAKPTRIDMQIENTVVDKTVFESGQQIFLSATLSKASYLYCYLSESGGNVIRLLPNATNPSALVSANLAIRIPDWMSSTPGFVLDTGAPGTETVSCIATDQNVLPKLPAPLQAQGLTVIPGVRGMASVKDAFTQALGNNGYVEQTMQWNVIPRRAAPATAVN